MSPSSGDNREVRLCYEGAFVGLKVQFSEKLFQEHKEKPVKERLHDDLKIKSSPTTSLGQEKRHTARCRYKIAPLLFIKAF